MIDTHCHIDQYERPASIARACEREEITTIAVTSLPSHYSMAVEHLAGHAYVHPALGFHPLVAAQNANEITSFENLAPHCRFIGEIGIDGSKAGLQTLPKQIEAFERVIASISRKQRFVTLHSRGAVREVLKCLTQYAMYPVVFHWFSGTRSELDAIVEAGHFLSFNPAMAATAKWQSEITRIPLNRILTETDGPYTKIASRQTKPGDVDMVLGWIATRLGQTRREIEDVVASNFAGLLGNWRS